MSWGGSALAMAQSIRFNKHLLKKRNTFEKLRIQYEQKIEWHTKTHDKEISPEELRKVRSEIKQQVKKEKRKFYLVFILSVLVTLALGYVSFYLINKQQGFLTDAEVVTKEQVAKKNREENQKFLFCIKDAKERFAKGEYHNAVFQYGVAVKLKPDNMDANWGLLRSHIEYCIQDHSQCKQSLATLKEMANKFQGNKEFIKLVEEYLETKELSSIIVALEKEFTLE